MEPTFVSIPNEYPDIDSRAPIRRPFVASNNRLEPEQRFFGALGLLGGNNAITITSSSRTGLFKTRTVASLAQTLYTITSTTYCIPSAQVLGAAVCAAAGRRRREVAFINDLVEEAKRQHQEKERFLRSVIDPDSVEKSFFKYYFLVLQICNAILCLFLCSG